MVGCGTVWVMDGHQKCRRTVCAARLEGYMEMYGEGQQTCVSLQNLRHMEKNFVKHTEAKLLQRKKEICQLYV